jgi:hypothetical protein
MLGNNGKVKKTYINDLVYSTLLVFFLSKFLQNLKKTINCLYGLQKLLSLYASG